MMHFHSAVAYDTIKLEQQHRNAKLEHRRHLMERQHSRSAPRPQVHAVRRATVALAGAGLALAAFALYVI